METFWQDVRYAVRMVIKNRALTFIIVLTLGLGIGANAAIFSVVNSFLLRPLPVKDADQLMVLAISHPGNDDPHNISYLDMQDFRKGSTAFSDVSAFAIGFVGLTDHGASERITVSYVTGNFFTMLGVKPALGRMILPAEGQTAGADPVIVLGHSYWNRRFGGDPSVVGRAVDVNGRPFTIIGVVPTEFHGAYSVAEMDAYLPMGMSAIDSENTDIMTKRDSHSLHVLGSLTRGTSIQQATASLNLISHQLSAQYPDTDNDLRAYVFRETSARPEAQSSRQSPLVAAVFLGLVGLVLLVACVNVANILLVLSTSRQKELAIRATLGAGRARLVRQMLTESVILSSLGGAAGLVIGMWVSRMLGSIHLPGDLPFRFDFSLDWRVFAYVAAIAIGTGIVVGLMPSLRASRTNVNDALREGGRSNSSGAGGLRVRNLLVVMQVAGSLVLVIAAALFVRSLEHAQGSELGFRPDHVLNLSMDPAQIGYDPAHAQTFYHELEESARAIPGVQSASLAYSIPMSYYNSNANVTYQGQVLRSGEKGITAGYNRIGTGYLATMGIQLLKGREFTPADSEMAPHVAIVNQLFANKLWPGQDPIGKRFAYDSAHGVYAEVVGMTPNGKYGFFFDGPEPYFYVPISQDYSSLRVLQVRTAVPPQQLALPLKNLIRSMDPRLPVYDVITMDESLQGGNGFFLLRMGAMFAGSLGLLGLILAVVGVYGVVSYSASQRTHEIGIRLALGAQRRDVLKLVVGQGLLLVLVGLGIGVVVMIALSPLVGNLLFGVKPYDPLTYCSAVLILSAVALIACYIPARRSARIDPMLALRHE
jgi:macrolide transport system ATP-binding/permease protein